MNDKERLLSKAKAIPSRSRRLNYLREFVQALYLEKLREVRWFKSCAFMGGTCLRLCHGLPRFSEGLDFVSIHDGKLDLNNLNEKLFAANEAMRDCGFRIRTKPLKDRRNVWKTFVVVESLLREAGISTDPSETLQIKIEIDSNPPASFQYEPATAMNTDQDVIVPNIVKGVDSSLFGGKTHAVLYRAYLKGRDFFDLEWYLRNKIPMDVRIVEDTEKSLGKRVVFNRSRFIDALTTKIQSIDLEAAKADVSPFVENPDELSIIFDRGRLEHLAKNVVYRRPMPDYACFKKLVELAGRKGGSLRDFEKLLDERFFEIKEILDNEGIILCEPNSRAENSKSAILEFARKQWHRQR